MPIAEGGALREIEGGPYTERLGSEIKGIVTEAREAAKSIHGAKLFESEDAARTYLEKNVPPKEQDKEIDLAPLKENLFDTPITPTPGHYEFEGKNGIRISFDLIAANDAFDRCWRLYKNEEGHINGDYHPIFIIENLCIKTEEGGLPPETPDLDM